MRVIIQRVSQGKCIIDGEVISQIDQGMVLLVGFNKDDTMEDVNKLVNKLIGLRIFEDDQGKMNLSIQDVGGEILSISQFTLYANCKRGRRPSFDEVMPADQAREMYHKFNEVLASTGIKVAEGVFQADMKIDLINDGPTTIILESEAL